MCRPALSCLTSDHVCNALIGSTSWRPRVTIISLTFASWNDEDLCLHRCMWQHLSALLLQSSATSRGHCPALVKQIQMPGSRCRLLQERSWMVPFVQDHDESLAQAYLQQEAHGHHMHAMIDQRYHLLGCVCHTAGASVAHPSGSSFCMVPRQFSAGAAMAGSHPGTRAFECNRDGLQGLMLH